MDRDGSNGGDGGGDGGGGAGDGDDMSDCDCIVLGPLDLDDGAGVGDKRARCSAGHGPAYRTGFGIGRHGCADPATLSKEVEEFMRGWLAGTHAAAADAAGGAGSAGAGAGASANANAAGTGFVGIRANGGARGAAACRLQLFDPARAARDAAAAPPQAPNPGAHSPRPRRHPRMRIEELHKRRRQG